MIISLIPQMISLSSYQQKCVITRRGSISLLSIKGKVNICACKNCVVGKFTSCEYERGIIIVEGEETNDNIFDEWENAIDDTDKVTNTFGEILSEEYVSYDDYRIGMYIAIYSHSNATELFYICETKIGSSGRRTCG